MIVETAIRSKLTSALVPAHLEVVNESRMHSVPPGSETHFKVVVVSMAFEGLGSLERHRRVHAVLAAELSGGVHALTVRARTPGEWATESAVPFESPPCLGGSKAS